MSVYDVPADELISRAAKELKKLNELKPPFWGDFVKTGISRERPPASPDWWYTRAASVLRKTLVFGPIGVSKLRVDYGGRKNRGVAGEHTYKGSGNIIRKVFQQLEKAGFVKQGKKGNHKGRIATPKGTAFLDKLSNQIMKDLNVVIPPSPKNDSTDESKKVKSQKKKE